MAERTSGRVQALSEAERQRARFNLLTTGEVADRMSEDHITSDTVRSWCDAGWMRCVDGRKAGTKRPYYLMEWEWVQEFVAKGGAQAFLARNDEPWWWLDAA